MTIRKVRINMVCDGSYKTNLDKNRGATTWVIHYMDTDRYTWVSLTTIPQVIYVYRIELLSFYEILVLLESVCQIYQL